MTALIVYGSLAVFLFLMSRIKTNQQTLTRRQNLIFYLFLLGLWILAATMFGGHH